MTGPRRLPMWTVPDGVLESLTTCGPSTDAASSSAQSTPVPSTFDGCRRFRPRAALSPVLLAHAPSSALATVLGSALPSDGLGDDRLRRIRLADLDDRVREVPGGNLDHDLVALLAAEQGAPDRRLVGDAALCGLRLRGPDDEERLGPVVALHLHGGADLDVVRGRVLVDEGRVLDHRLEGLDPALDERLLVLGVLVLGVLREVAVFLRVVDPLRDLGAADGEHLVQLRTELVEAVLADVGRLAVHAVRTPEVQRPLGCAAARSAWNKRTPGGPARSEDTRLNS